MSETLIALLVFLSFIAFVFFKSHRTPLSLRVIWLIGLAGIVAIVIFAGKIAGDDMGFMEMFRGVILFVVAIFWSILMLKLFRR